MILILKLHSGKEVVGEVEYQNKQLIALKSPINIVYKPQLGGMPAVMFTPYTMFGKNDSVTFDTEHILNIITPSPVFEQYYAVLAERTEHTKIQVTNELCEILGLPVDEPPEMTDDDKQHAYHSLLEQWSVPTSNNMIN